MSCVQELGVLDCTTDWSTDARLLCLPQDSNYLTCLAVNEYLTKHYLLASSRSARSGKAQRPHQSELASLAAYGGYRPVVVARLPYTANNKDLLLRKQFVDVAVSLQEFKHTLLRYGFCHFSTACLLLHPETPLTSPRLAATG